MSTLMNEAIHGGNHDLSTSVLEAVKINGHLRGLSCELTIAQTFRNPGKKNIEAVYTFPLPHNAVLLELTAKIGERHLKGSVLPKAKAEERYEDAVSEGNGAIMLERSDDGICTVNFGNLMPGESASLEYRYAYLLEWQQDTVRFQLPTTIAPRYGDAIAAGYQPHQVPTTDMQAEYPFRLKLRVEGVLKEAMFDSPSHTVNVIKKERHIEVNLHDHRAWMDRDFVLNMKHAGAEKVDGQISDDPLSGTRVALASFCPQFPGQGFDSICTKIVIDCSGSMNGDSIEQARTGLNRILDNLRETDSFNVIRFGSTHRAYFPIPVLAKGRNLRNARMQVDNLIADLGGTEMDGALDFAYGSDDGSTRPKAILLITDGEISNHREVIRKAVKSGHRIFTVGVGSAVAEEFVRGIASKTGGACELVSPNEGMADAIYRQFQRMKQPRAAKVSVIWPRDVSWQSPAELGPVFAGDTLHVFADLSDSHGGKVRLSLETEDGGRIEQEVEIAISSGSWESLPRVAAASRIADLDKNRPALAEELSNTYQLVTRHTNYLIVEERIEDRKAQDLPELVRISQMLAAGWGGTGRVDIQSSVSNADILPVAFSRRQATPAPDVIMSPSFSLPNFLRKQTDDTLPDISHTTPEFDDDNGGEESESQIEFHAEMRNLIRQLNTDGKGWLATYRSGILRKLPAQLRKALKALATEGGWDEATLAASLLLALIGTLHMDIDHEAITPVLKESADRHLIRFFGDGLELYQDSLEWNNTYECDPAR